MKTPRPGVQNSGTLIRNIDQRTEGYLLIVVSWGSSAEPLVRFFFFFAFAFLCNIHSLQVGNSCNEGIRIYSWSRSNIVFWKSWSMRNVKGFTSPYFTVMFFCTPSVIIFFNNHALRNFVLLSSCKLNTNYIHMERENLNPENLFTRLICPEALMIDVEGPSHCGQCYR